MSTITTTGSSLKNTTIPAALLEAALLLDAAEKSRNGANPGIAPKNNLSVTFASDEGTASIAASIPADIAVGAAGQISYTAKDYLGAIYTPFTAGGDVTAANRVAAFVQVAQILSAAEKAVQPVEDQPNNVTVESSSETGTITVTANLPVAATVDGAGKIVFEAVDYL